MSKNYESLGTCSCGEVLVAWNPDEKVEYDIRTYSFRIMAQDLTPFCCNPSCPHNKEKVSSWQPTSKRVYKAFLNKNKIKDV